MKRILFIDMHREGRSPSQRFRYEQYLDTLKFHGFSVEHSYLLNEWDDLHFYLVGNYLAKGWILTKSVIKRCRDVIRAFNYDYVFIQREAFMLGTSFFELIFSKSGAKIIFDFDDSIWLTQISTSSPNRSLSFLKNPSKTSRIIKLANTVVVGNNYLAGYASKYNSNVKVIPTTIDTESYQPKPKQFKNTITIGWSGSKTTIDHFLVAIPALKILKEKYKKRIEIVVIGDSCYNDSELGICGKEWSILTEVDDLNTFDIGIMPLPDDEWAKGKCGLKALQYMALEIPSVLSPVGVNNEIINSGENGFLASSTEDWVSILSDLVETEELRKRIGKNGRKTVVSNYSVISQTENFLSLFL